MINALVPYKPCAQHTMGYSVIVDWWSHSQSPQGDTGLSRTMHVDSLMKECLAYALCFQRLVNVYM